MFNILSEFMFCRWFRISEYW